MKKYFKGRMGFCPVDLLVVINKRLPPWLYRRLWCDTLVTKLEHISQCTESVVSNKLVVKVSTCKKFNSFCISFPIELLADHMICKVSTSVNHLSHHGHMKSQLVFTKHKLHFQEYGKLLKFSMAEWQDMNPMLNGFKVVLYDWVHHFSNGKYCS